MSCVLVKNIIVFFFCLLNVNTLFALYPEKEGYVYEKSVLDLYVGFTYNAIVSETFNSLGGNKLYNYGSIVSPLNQLENAGFSAQIGMRLFNGSSINWIKNFRFESESMYLYNRTEIMNDTAKHDSTLITSDYPDYGQEVLSSSLFFNIYYDFREDEDDLFYPYIGFGGGYGNVKYLHVDVNEQPNGIGEFYEGNAFVPLGQLMFGLQHDTKIIKSSVFIQYRIVASAAVDAIPYNNGTEAIVIPQDANNNPINPIPAGYQPPVAQKLGLLNHGISFGFKYYLY